MTARAICLAAACLAASLSACSGEPAATPEAEATEAAPEPAPTASALAEPSAAPSAVPTEPAGAADSVPTAVRGRWGLVPADCASTRGDNKGLLTIGADKLEFYESVALLGQVKERDDSRIRATFKFSGEGQTWTNEMTLDAQDGGSTLIRRDYGEGAMPGPLKYTRC